MKKTEQLALLEQTVKALGYNLRYEKGTFLGGECRLRENRVVVVNKFLPVEGRLYTLAQIISRLNPPGLSSDVVKIIDTLVTNTLFTAKKR